jgi:hypothetical protein
VFLRAGRIDLALDWWKRGIGWADEGVDIARRYDYAPMLYAILEARIRIQQRLPKDAPEALTTFLRPKEDLRLEQLAIDTKRLTTTRSLSRRHRSVIKAERTLSEVMTKDWCASFDSPRPLAEFRPYILLLQRLKTFNFGELVRDDSDSCSMWDETLVDDAVDPEEGSPDIYERREHYEELEPESGYRELAQHLSQTNAAVLEFLTHPSMSENWYADLKKGWGTVCLIVKAVNGELYVRPVFLNAPESLIMKVALTGDPNDDFAGLESDLPRWPWEGRLSRRLPNMLFQLGQRLFPQELIKELSHVSHLYICPHRHLFQIPLHALVTSEQKVLFEKWTVTYAMKISHLIDLLSRQSTNASGPLWSLVDTSDPNTAKLLSALAHWIDPRTNIWGTAGIAVEDILKGASQSNLAIVLGHAQKDEGRAGRARLRLWGGGRLLADDIHRVGEGYENTNWIIVACDAAFSRVRMQTGPGIALSLVTLGAPSVTACIYRVTSVTAQQFVDSLFRAPGNGDSRQFTDACREIMKSRSPFVQRWAAAASFVSYGLAVRPPIPEAMRPQPNT